jgi:O-antigen ligase
MSLHTAAAWIAALFLASSVFAQNVALRLLLLAAGIVLAAVLTHRYRGQICALPPIWLPFLLWGGWALLSLTWSLEPERTLKEWRNEVFYTGAALWICYVGAQAQAAARIFLPVLTFAGAGACILALRQFAQGWQQYTTGWHGGPGDHSSALLVLMPCTVVAGWYASRAGAPRWTLAVAGSLVALFFASAYTTLNRTIWLGFAAQFALLAALLLLRRRSSAGMTPALSSQALAPALAVAAVIGCSAMVVNVQAERQVTGAGGPLQGDSRIMLWPRVAEYVAERPLTGYGFGRGVLRDLLQEKLRQRDINLWHAHNYFLDAALQVGVPGLLLFVLLIGATLREAWRWSGAADDWIAACGLALAAVVAGMLVRNMTDTLLVRQNALLYWGMVGMLLGLARKKWRASS